MKGYVWYSYGSDKTGPRLAEALGFKFGKKTPDFSAFDLIIGWGCKPGEKYRAKALADRIGKRGIRVLNHVDVVNGHRNKPSLFQKLHEAGINTPGFVHEPKGKRALLTKALKALEEGELDFPLLALNESHKGYPIFCYTVNDVVEACSREGRSGVTQISYLRSFCPGTEFKIHVFRDTALAAEKKVLAADPLKKLGEHLLRKVKRRASKEEIQIRATEKEIGWITEELAQDLLNSPNHMQRSVTHGWSLEVAELGEVPDHVLAQAINALDASGLDLGAVSVVCDGEVARVTGITSAPGLSEDQMGLYVSAIQEFAKAEKPKRNVAKTGSSSPAEEAAPQELIARLKQKLPGVSRRNAKVVLATLEG